MTKLRFDGGYWANRPRDAANLARFAGRQLEHPFNWQVVNVERDWTEWNDSPVLELASHKAPNLGDADLDKLRHFVQAGGLLFTQADGDSPEFNAYAARLARDLFPQYELSDVPPNHPLYTKDTVFNVDPRPPLKMVSNGSRVLMLHSPTDLTRFWQQRDDLRHRNVFQLGVNLFVYAAGRRDFRNRLQGPWVSEPEAAPLLTVKLVRLRYAGNWDPEPLAWERYANWLQRKTGTRVDARETAAADLRDLNPEEFPLAHLTGTAKHDFAAAAAAAVRAYVRSGGVLLIDACGGGATAATGSAAGFNSSAEALLAAAFPEETAQTLQANHPMLLRVAPGTEDVTQRRLRPEAASRLGRDAGALKLLASGKGHVLYAPLDLTSGLLGTSTLGVAGYDPAYAQSLMKNVVFWVLDGQAER